MWIKLNMASLDDLWPLVEKFLESLENEPLSKSVENERVQLLERIEIAKLPPSLPPLRPENGTDTIAQLREQSRTEFNPPCSEDLHDDGELYDDITNFEMKTEPVIEASQSDSGLYEQPKSGSQRQEIIEPEEDSHSDGSGPFESYDEDDGFSSDDEMQQSAPAPDDFIPLPRKKSTSRKKYGGLGDIAFTGELSCKGIFSTEKKACIVQNGKLLVFKSERSQKPQQQVDLDAYEAVFFEKDGKHQNVIKFKRANTTGGNEHWFCADSKSTAQKWMQYFNTKDPDKASIASRDSSSVPDSGIQGDGSTPSGSEGGSGDGQVPYNDQPAVSSPPPTDTNKKSKDKPKQSFGEKLIKTIGRQKGNKTALKLESMEFETDPEATMEGWVSVKSESLLGSKKWQKVFCQIKNNSLHCYKQPGDEAHQFCLSLTGLTLDPANMNNHSLAYKLSNDEQISLYLEPADVIEQGKWLNVLIKETECGSPRMKSASSTDGANEEPFVKTGTMDDVYNEVYDHRSTKVMPRSKGAPPPLPANPPPVRTPPSIKRVFGQSSENSDTATYDDANHDRLRRQQEMDETDDAVDNDESYDDVRFSPGKEKADNQDSDSSDELYDDVELNNNRHAKRHDKLDGRITETNTVKIESVHLEYKTPPSEGNFEVEYKNTESERAKTGKRLSESKDGEKAKNEADGKQVDALIKKLKAKEEARKAQSVEPSHPSDPNIVQCSLGPTIAADEEILNSTTNPILSELRTSGKKTWNPGEKKEVENEISQLKTNVANIRKKRAQIRSKRLTTTSAAEKAKFEEQLQQLDVEMEEAQAQLTKLQLLEQQKNAASSKGVSPKTSPRGVTKKSTSPLSNRPFTPTNRSSTPKTSSTTKTLPVIGGAKSSTTTPLRTTRVSNTTTTKSATLPATNKTNSDPSSRSNQRKSADSKTETRTSTYSWRSDRTTSSTTPVTSSRIVTSQKVQLGQSKEAPSSRSSSVGTVKPIGRTRVQDQLKLWRAMEQGEDSNC